MRVAVVAVLALSGCASTTAAEKQANGIATMAVGGGFVAVSTVTLAGGVVGAAIMSSQPATAKMAPIAFLVPAGVAALEVTVGGLLLSNGREEYLDGVEGEEVARQRRARSIRPKIGEPEPAPVPPARARVVPKSQVKPASTLEDEDDPPEEDYWAPSRVITTEE